MQKVFLILLTIVSLISLTVNSVSQVVNFANLVYRLIRILINNYAIYKNNAHQNHSGTTPQKHVHSRIHAQIESVVNA